MVLGFRGGFRQLSRALEGAGARTGANTQAILTDAVEVHQTLSAQHSHTPSQLLGQPILVSAYGSPTGCGS